MGKLGMGVTSLLNTKSSFSLSSLCAEIFLAARCTVFLVNQYCFSLDVTEDLPEYDIQCSRKTIITFTS